MKNEKVKVVMDESVGFPPAPPKRHRAWFRRGQKWTHDIKVTKPKHPAPLKGHHNCPCGSGKKYRNCCRASVGKGA